MQAGYAARYPLIATLGKQSYLLISLMALLVLLPMLTSEDTSRFWLSAILTLIVFAGPLSLATEKIGFFVSLALGIVMITNSWLGEWTASSSVQAVMDVVTVIFFLILGVLIFRQHVFQSKSADLETLFGAVNGYICMGIMYAFAYSYLLQSDPAAFSGHLIENPTFESCVYLSFVTMTTLGYGDITPQTDPAAILTWTQALVGQLYIALSVARVVGLMVAKEVE